MNKPQLQTTGTCGSISPVTRQGVEELPWSLHLAPVTHDHLLHPGARAAVPCAGPLKNSGRNLTKGKRRGEKKIEGYTSKYRCYIWGPSSPLCFPGRNILLQEMMVAVLFPSLPSLSLPFPAGSGGSEAPDQWPHQSPGPRSAAAVLVWLLLHTISATCTL